MPDIKGAGEGAADKGKGALTRKVGPLPLWGWAVAGVAAVVVVKKFTGGSSGAGAGPGIVPIAATGPGAGGGAPVTPSAGVTAPPPDASASAPPWWSSPPAWWNATSHAGGLDHPSTNGSRGSGTSTSTTGGSTGGGASTGGSWFTKLLNPSGGLPAGADSTTIGGTLYSLSDAALGRAGITGAVPVANATARASTTSVSGVDPQGNPWVSQYGGVGAGPARTDIQGVAPPPPKPGQAGYKGWLENSG